MFKFMLKSKKSIISPLCLIGNELFTVLYFSTYILIIPLFGDFKHTFILSSFLLKNYLSKFKSSKYTIVCSYPGFSYFFPYCNEFWSLSDFSNFKKIYEKSDVFDNSSVYFENIIRSLNENFRNVCTPEQLSKYYSNGFTDDYYKSFGREFDVFYPMVPSSAVLGKEFLNTLNVSPGYKVFINPSICVHSWRNGKCYKINVGKEFYLELIKFLKKNNFFPVVWKHNLAFDLTEDFADHQDCLFLNEYDIFKVCSAMRATGCVLDIFNGTSKLARTARVPCLTLDERSKYHSSKEYEIDDLSAFEGLPNFYVYTFMSSIINGFKNHWDNEMFLYIKNNLINLISCSDRDLWPTTSEMVKKVNANVIRQSRNKKLGTKFIKINSID